MIPAPLTPEPELGFVPPRDACETQLVLLWEQLLGVQPVGVRDNFFDLGGDSILVMQIVSRAARVGLRVTPKQIFKHQTIAELASVTTVEAAPPA